LILVAISAVSSCGTSSAGTEATSLAPVITAADTTILSTSVVATDQATAPRGPNWVASTALVPGVDVVVDDPLVPGSFTGARTGRDGLSLSLFFVGAPDYEPGQPCTMRYTPVVNETDSEVDIAMRGEHPPADDDAMMCAANGSVHTVTVDLAQPFGTRTLVALGQARGVFDGSTLSEPQWLPDGWQADDESPGPVGQDGSTWSRSWRPVGDSSCPLGTSGLALLEGTPEAVSRSSFAFEQPVTGSHDINGTTATETFQANRNVTFLAWTVGDRSYVLSSAPACDGDQPPSLDTMLQFARSLDTTAEPVPATTINAPPLTTAPSSGVEMATIDSELGRVSYVLPPKSWADPQDVGQVDDFIVGHAWWIVPDCCYLKLTLQDFEPPRPPEEHVGQFESNGMAWDLYDIGPRDRSTVVASATVNGLTISVGAQGQSGASTDPSPSQIAESVARSVVVT
jgi:hypothetical protein